MWLSRVLGGIMIVGGTIFLAANSLILFRGAYRFGHDDADKLAFGVAAAVVPFVIVVAGIMMSTTWQATRWGFRRPTANSLIITGLWVVFVGYNLINGSGVIGLAREETVAERQKATTDLTDARARRTRLLEQRGSLPKHRPSVAVEALIEAEKVKKTYAVSEQCSAPRTAMQRETCGEIQRLEAEAATAQQAEQIDAEVARLDQAISDSGPVMAVADPQTELIHDALGLERDRIQLWLPALTPIVLEIGGAFCWHFGFGLLGWRVRRVEHDELAPPKKTAQPDFNTAPLMSPERARAPAVTPLERLTSQRQLAEWFFRECTRAVPAGAMSESDWYEQYSEICRRSNDQPISVESFRRIASNHVPRMHPVDGAWVYFEVLPRVPEVV